MIMSWPDIYLFCFAVGAVWTLASLVLGGLHLHVPKLGFHGSHVHVGGHVQVGAHAPGQGSAHLKVSRGSVGAGPLAILGSMINPSCAAVFLAWFGGVGYLTTRHSTLTMGIALVIALAAGLAGAYLLASFLRFLAVRERPLDPFDYDMIGVLGRVSSVIRSSGVGEVVYVRDGARRPVCACSEDGIEIPRGEEVVVTRYEKGIAYVRTWEAMTQTGL